MDKDLLRSGNNGSTCKDGGLLRASSEINTRQTASSDFVLQWGNRKRLRCMKVQVKDDSSASAHRTTVRVVRTDKDTSNQPSTATANHNIGNGYFNLRRRPSSPPPPPPPPQRVLRNSENSSAMRGQSNGGVRGFASPDRGAHDKRGTRHNNHNHHNNDYNKSGASSETAHDSKKGGSSSASGEAAPPVWPPKFVIALTNKEKEEDFMAIKGSKLPQRPKKRAKFIQRTVNEYFIGVQHLGAQGTIDLLRPFDDILGWDTVFKNVAVTTNMVAGSDPDLCETMIYFIIIFLLVFNFCFRLKIGLCVK
ncbi:uncharacterized protein LOC102613558 isoform X1 [Citrus sinensis]|uniref:uncharacterized protein LOC102613558 isoform X1 n=1 Tax=Citrus sinensis TaxID=2711 RepID=UPI0003D76721|nr:uncharacterized protein LOC102613558 isoform X1 [Citrus sinensis]XP_006475969.1 uncharacterized protein LOC102613558 isoform X1 [Citrus sinensis]